MRNLAYAAILVVIGLGLLSPRQTHSQTPADAEPSEKAFKNVQVLKGIPADEFLTTMGFFSASLGESCTYCHVAESGGSWEKYADDNAHKQIARKMITMVAAINQMYFGGRRELTCYSCHRGGERPLVTPNLADLYGPPRQEEPDAFVEPRNKGATAEQILDRYLDAIGGTQKLGSVTSYAAKGNYQGFSDVDQRPVEIFAKAPDQRTTIVHTLSGDSTTTYDGRAGWTAAPATDQPMPLLELSGGELDGLKIDAEMAFPGRIKQFLKQWRVGYPARIDGKEVEAVQGTRDGRYPVNLYFDKSGLLVRMVRYRDSAVGLNPTQIDYSDYRTVSGIKMPFQWTVTWLDGRATTQLSDVELNVPVDASLFSRPPQPSTHTR